MLHGSILEGSRHLSTTIVCRGSEEGGGRRSTPADGLSEKSKVHEKFRHWSVRAPNVITSAR